MEKHFQYLRYVLFHKWYVLIECIRLGVFWRGLVHDLSKFSPVEWFPYVEYFYGDGSKTIRGKHLFNVAWNHHQKANDHHWQYWLLQYDNGNGECLLMPDQCKKEMLADWRGAGRAQGKPDTKAWYMLNREKIKLHPSTRNWIEQQLNASVPPIQPVLANWALRFIVVLSGFVLVWAVRSRD